MVGDNEQLSWIRKGFIFRKPSRVSVAVRADDRQVAYAAVKPSGDGTGAWIGREKSVFVEERRGLRLRRQAFRIRRFANG